ncbi:hypothetical protein [Burkholderia contaminans]|uniref:hypothetical protein n=1 Tax=Burkholderia contaminans TaxID=488447 RepID=UPI000F59326F|nr:hypothetical protein [Burkholderia contaminans]
MNRIQASSNLDSRRRQASGADHIRVAQYRTRLVAIGLSIDDPGSYVRAHGQAITVRGVSSATANPLYFDVGAHHLKARIRSQPGITQMHFVDASLRATGIARRQQQTN